MASRTRPFAQRLETTLEQIVTLIQSGISIVGCVDVCDRANRLLGIIYGNVGQLQQRPLTGDVYVQLRDAGVEYDARDVSDRWARQLGQVDLQRYLGVACGPANPIDVTAVIPAGVDVTDRWPRQLGQIDLARVLGGALTSANPVIAGIFDPLGNRMPAMDAVARRGYVAITDGTETLSIDANNRAETAPVQTTRTNLTVKGEREDTSLVYGTFAAGVAADVAVLGAGGGLLKHKIYSCGYTIDAAVQAGFRFNSANPRFCVRRTAGVFAQSFTHPVVSVANVTLTLRVEGAVNGDYWCQFVTEA